MLFFKTTRVHESVLTAEYGLAKDTHGEGRGEEKEKLIRYGFSYSIRTPKSNLGANIDDISILSI